MQLIRTVLLFLSLVAMSACFHGVREGGQADTRPTIFRYIDGLTVETVLRAGAAALSAVGIACIIAAIIIGIWAQRPKTGIYLGATGVACFFGGAAVAWIGTHLWWLLLSGTILCLGVAYLYIRTHGERLEQQLGIDIPYVGAGN